MLNRLGSIILTVLYGLLLAVLIGAMYVVHSVFDYLHGRTLG
jgi:hypothetical protein